MAPSATLAGRASRCSSRKRIARDEAKCPFRNLGRNLKLGRLVSVSEIRVYRAPCFFDSKTPGGGRHTNLQPQNQPQSPDATFATDSRARHPYVQNPEAPANLKNLVKRVLSVCDF